MTFPQLFLSWGNFKNSFLADIPFEIQSFSWFLSWYTVEYVLKVLLLAI
jgi:hypothetical protein